MRRRATMVLLALGVVGGYGSGIAHLVHARRYCEFHREQVAREFAQRCVEAARGRERLPTGFDPRSMH